MYHTIDCTLFCDVKFEYQPDGEQKVKTKTCCRNLLSDDFVEGESMRVLI